MDKYTKQLWKALFSAKVWIQGLSHQMADSRVKAILHLFSPLVGLDVNSGYLQPLILNTYLSSQDAFPSIGEPHLQLFHGP
jgi:hypothetical protein